MYEKPKLDIPKHPRGSAFFETSKTFIVWVGWWVCGRWSQFPLILKIRYSYKLNVLILNVASKLSTAIRPKVMSKSSLKTWNFKVDFRGGNQLKKMMVTKDLSSRRKLRIVFKKKIYRKKGILGPKIWKKLKVQKWCQNGSNSII